MIPPRRENLASGYAQQPDGSFSKPKRNEFCISRFKPKPVQSSGPVAESSSATPRKRIRQPEADSTELNALEAEFLALLPELFNDCCIPSEIICQSIRFRLGNGAWYKPDFVIPSIRTCVETKGPKQARWARTGERDIKIAASLFPQFKWFLAWKDDGAWQTQEVLP